MAAPSYWTCPSTTTWRATSMLCTLRYCSTGYVTIKGRTAECSVRMRYHCLIYFKWLAGQWHYQIHTCNMYDHDQGWAACFSHELLLAILYTPYLWIVHFFNGLQTHVIIVYVLHATLTFTQLHITVWIHLLCYNSMLLCSVLVASLISNHK